MSFKRLLLVSLLVSACSEDHVPEVGDTSFESAPPGGSAANRGGEAADTTGTPPATPGTSTSTSATPRTVEETDVYRLDGDRLYFLNAYRGLMVFDVADADHPRLLGRAPIYGSPVEMVVRDGVAVVVVADWYGALEDGTPFHGSVVRGFDARDPAHIKPLGEAKLGGWVTDTRVVGDVLYAVSVDYGWSYGVYDTASGGGDVATTTTATGPSVIVSSVRFAGGAIAPVSRLEYPGWGGIFHVTASSVLLAHDVAAKDNTSPPSRSELEYLDISDPAGAIVPRGKISVDGRVQGWGADNGRWNLDFADGKTARIVACSGSYYGCGGYGGYVVSTVDFTNPDVPALRSELDVPSTGWSVAARFEGTRLYLSPASYDGSKPSTPFMIIELGDKPRVAGTAQVPGMIWNLLPGPGATMFALGNDWGNQVGDSVTLSYVDVNDAAAPRVLGTARFGEGWAWTPAAGTFKAFTFDEERGLVVLPFSGWSEKSYTYTNGLQLIEVTPTSIRTAGVARTKGWVERGIFVGDRLVSLSDTSLSVVDFANPDAPTVVTELTLARNVVGAEPHGATVAALSTDFWGYDVSESEVRILPTADVEELRDSGPVPTLTVAGTNAHSFRNGDLAYVVTDVQTKVSCDSGQPGRGGDVIVGGGTCFKRAQQVQVLDLSGGNVKKRGQIRLPEDSWGWGWGWWGFYAWDWFDGAEVVQAGPSALAFRRWQPIWTTDGKRLDDNSKLYVVDLANPDKPALASVAITADAYGWWGNMRVVGSTLYATHFEWIDNPETGSGGRGRYYADRIDLGDLAHPRVQARVNVPGLLIGGAEDDPSLLYFIDYRWNGTTSENDLDVARISGDVATLVSRTTLLGYAGGGVVRGRRVYMTVETWDQTTGRSSLRLHALDLSDPRKPVDRASQEREGWGWLLDVQGDRAILSSGWGTSGIDIYKLRDGKAPAYEQFVRTRGWWPSAVSRQGNTLFLASGSWGVQRIDL